MTNTVPWDPSWVGLLTVGVPMGLAAIAFLFGHTTHTGDPRRRYREMAWDRTGWFLLGAAAMAGGLIAWWAWS